MQQGRSLAAQPPSYYGGALTVGQTPAETQAWASRGAYNDSVYGGSQAPQFGDLTGALSRSLNGGSDIGNMSSQLSPYATSALTSGFRPTDTSGIAGIGTPTGTNAASQIGQYGFGTSLDAAGKAPTFGVAGNLDARGAFQQALTGQPDYAGVQGAIDSANAPILRDFQQNILPSLNQRATFTNNETGGVKALNRVLPDIGQRMSENAQTITNNERLRALSAQQDAASQIAQGGYQGYGLGLQTAQGERGLEQNLAGLGLNTDTTRAQLGLSDYGTRLNSANFGLNQQGMLADSQARDRADLLNLGSLGAQTASSAGSQNLNAISQFPSVYNVGRQPGTDQLEYANYDRALQEDALAADQQRFNYLRDQPMNQLSQYAGLINGTASPYATSSTTVPGGSRTAGALGGALAGAQIGNSFGYPGWGAILGGLGGYLGT